MIPYPLKRFLLSPTELHIACALLALGSCVPAIFPEVCPEDAADIVKHYAGYGLMSSFLFSLGCMILAGMVHLMRLNNVKALGQLVKWGIIWGTTFGLFILLALAADVSAPDDGSESDPIQLTDTLYQANDQLTGPESLTIPLLTDNSDAEHLPAMPHLLYLEREHPELLGSYLEHSPRWQSRLNDDTFYSKPGHLVMVPPTAAGTPGLVHVCFRRLTEGDPLPAGYTVVKPGDTFPSAEEGASHAQLPDLAVDLGRNHYLLLAWRGTAHAETAHKALYAAAAAIDERMQILAESPTVDTAQRMLRGRESYSGSTPEIRLSEPPGQGGAYQAEIYANPGEPGTLLLYVRDLESGDTLRLLNCKARYSADKDELFRHNIPCDVGDWLRSNYTRRIDEVLPQNAPVFIIDIGSEHRYFGVALEVWFEPTDRTHSRTRLLRRCYRVQHYDAAAHSPLNLQDAPAAEPQLPNPDTPPQPVAFPAEEPPTPQATSKTDAHPSAE